MSDDNTEKGCGGSFFAGLILAVILASCTPDSFMSEEQEEIICDRYFDYGFSEGIRYCRRNPDECFD